MENKATMNYKLNCMLFLIFFGLIYSCAGNENVLTVNSPDRKYTIQLKNEEGIITYILRHGSKILIDKSELSILPDFKSLIINAEINSKYKVWKPTWGQFSEIEDHYNELVLTINLERATAKLYARAYKKGIGFRYDLEGYEKKAKANCSRSLGVKGIKYGFMNENVAFTRKAISKSAKNKLLIDFHDNPVPIAGIRRTFPNTITREVCHAQQDSRKTFTPETFIKMALVNAIQGTIDMNNGNFVLVGINKGDREKGPKKVNSYLSTVASEAARTLIVLSGLVCIPDAPEAYAAKSDLFEFIQKLPVGKWDESIVLHANINEYISTARRQGEEWFIGSVYNQQGGALDFTLDFLKEGQNYKVTYYEDTNETHCKNNPEAYQIRKGLVQKGDIVKAKMAPKRRSLYVDKTGLIRVLRKKIDC